MSARKYNPLIEEADATDEVITIVMSIVDGWYSETAIDWDDVWDRADGTELPSGEVLDIENLASPAIRRIKQEVRRIRRDGDTEALIDQRTGRPPGESPAEYTRRYFGESRDV